jgi:membrane protease YdiL (CAAX protease family)
MKKLTALKGLKELKGLLAERTAGIQLLSLLCLALLGFTLLGIGASLLEWLPSQALGELNRLRLLQLLTSLCFFLLPTLGLAYLCSTHPSAYLSLERRTPIVVWLAVGASMLLLQPGITFLGFLNSQMQLPDFLAPVEQWMQAMEASAETMTQFLLSPDDWLSLLLNLLVIALGAGLTEEFFFRGAIQRLLERKISSHHAVVWLAACIFSFIHLQFYGFVPRLLLGAYFGYLLYWSGNLWLPVFAHFTHNAFAIIGMSNSQLKENAIVSGEISDAELPWFALTAGIFLILFFFCARFISMRLSFKEENKG